MLPVVLPVTVLHFLALYCTSLCCAMLSATALPAMNFLQHCTLSLHCTFCCCTSCHCAALPVTHLSLHCTSCRCTSCHVLVTTLHFLLLYFLSLCCTSCRCTSCHALVAALHFLSLYCTSCRCTTLPVAVLPDAALTDTCVQAESYINTG